MAGKAGFEVVSSYFEHYFAICSDSLHLKQFDWSVVTNIRYWVSSCVTTRMDESILFIYSSFMYTCHLKYVCEFRFMQTCSQEVSYGCIF